MKLKDMPVVLTVPSLYLFFPIAPIAKERPRLGKRGRVYTPRRTKAFESQIALLAKSQMLKATQSCFKGALNVHLRFILRSPKRKINVFPSVKPDLDNYIKSTLDALNGIVWKDDAQVVNLISQKYYSVTGQDIGISVEVWEMGKKVFEVA